MSVDMPNFHFGTVIIAAKKQLFKQGWYQCPDSGRMDTIQKDFPDNVTITTIGAGDKLLLQVHKTGFDPREMNSYIPFNHPAIIQAKSEINAVVERIVKHNRKKFEREILEYEAIVHPVRRSEKYGL